MADSTDMELEFALNGECYTVIVLDALVEMLEVASSHSDLSLIPAALDRMLEYLDHWYSSAPERVASLFERLDPSRLKRAVGQTLLALGHRCDDAVNRKHAASILRAAKVE